MIKSNLHTFLRVCEKGSFTKAAAALYITPSAVIQQINALEHDLGTTLFIRTSKGISKTPAGEYLFVQGQELAQKNALIRKTIRSVSTAGNEICVGTSLMEKCRLLYDLWVLFAEKEKGYTVKMVPIDSGHLIPEQTDLVESVNGNVPWTRSWEFMEICQVPFGFAFSKEHPLSAKKVILPSDLKGETVISVNNGTSDKISSMLEALQQLGVNLIFRESADNATLWECAFHRYSLVVPLCWEDILINMVTRPCQWDYSIPYGIFYRPSPTPAVCKFLDFIRRTYQGQDPRETFWVL